MVVGKLLEKKEQTTEFVNIENRQVIYMPIHNHIVGNNNSSKRWTYPVTYCKKSLLFITKWKLSSHCTSITPLTICCGYLTICFVYICLFCYLAILLSCYLAIVYLAIYLPYYHTLMSSSVAPSNIDGFPILFSVSCVR